VTTVVVRTSKE